MPKTKTEEKPYRITTPRFYIPSEAFCEIWNNVITSTDSSNQDWNKFVAICWERFRTDHINKRCLDWAVSQGSLDTEKEIYDFMNDRVFSKCQTIKKGLASEGCSVELPNGWRMRNGSSKPSRPSYKDLAGIFKSDAAYEGPGVP